MTEMETTEVNGVRHYVTPSGLLYPSVTTVLKHLSAADIAAWRARVGHEEAEKVSQKASTRGTSVHDMCEKYLSNQSDLLHEAKYEFDSYTFDKMKPYLHKIDYIYGLETPMYSNRLRIAGRADCIAEYNGVLSIIDFKTSLKEKKKSWITNYFIQETAYAVMYEERTEVPIQQIVTLIATDAGDTQEFIEQADNWKKPLTEAIKSYRKLYHGNELNL
jgi:genome maintenance exonuclease 1